MAAEDFSYLLAPREGAMAMVGICPPDVLLHEAAPLQSNRMRMGQNGLSAGVALYAGVAMHHLGALG